MRKQLEQYVKNQLKTLKYKGDKVNLENVYPSLLEYIIGDFTPYELNGYDCDYWVSYDKYEICGCMRTGIAEITLIEGPIKNKDTKQNEIKKQEEKKILRINDISKETLSQLKTFYFTFGSGQKHEGYFQPILSKNISIANKKMFEIYNKNWSFMYDEEKWKDTKKYYINKSLEPIVAL